MSRSSPVLEMTEVDDDHTICSICQHYRFLHDVFVECCACDSPEYPIEKRCPGFQAKESQC